MLIAGRVSALCTQIANYFKVQCWLRQQIQQGKSQLAIVGGQSPETQGPIVFIMERRKRGHRNGLAITAFRLYPNRKRLDYFKGT